MARTRRLIVAALACATVAVPMVTTSVTGTAQAARPTTKAAPQNTLGVRVVRFKKGTSRADMYAAVSAAGGEVLNDLSKIGRLAVRSDAKTFDSKLSANRNVAALWTDRLIKIDLVDADTETGSNNPALGNPGATGPFDPWHDADGPFVDQDAPGVWLWDDDANGARGAREAGVNGDGITVAVIDTGVQGSHKELLPNYDNHNSTNTIPCNLLTRQFGPGLGQRDCSSEDTEGHGTWVASRIGGAVNGFASNGIAPDVTIIGYKALSTTLGGGLTSWITDAMVRACDAGADLINMSLGGYDKPGVDDEDYLMWVDATNYCRGKGTAIIASAGNEHVRVNTVDMTIGGRNLTGVGQVDSGDEGIITIIPGDTVVNNDIRGMLETPAGVPGVIMVSATNNVNGDPVAGSLAHLASTPQVGASDQLAYYSSYGDRIDIAAPGGARKLGIPRYDAGPQDVLYGGYGELGALTQNGEICQDPSLASFLTFACFKVQGAAFGWLQGTSMSAPNTTGVAALTLSAHPGLTPDQLLTHLQNTARTDMVNGTGPVDPTDTGPDFFGNACASGYCHLDYFPGGAGNSITFSDAYGAGIVDAAAAVG